MPEVDREMCRKAAAECIELARATTDPARKEMLLIRAQEWIKLAYADSVDEFQRLIAERNDSQMGMQRQPMQQQQSKRDEESSS